ncbi:hypothetical protein GGX14DRAFT_556903 [Mycena pura]|uniref:Uncharacterized protein n=1 Tax=Mycena pura TaxID=153505 RepID=A0AAD7E3C7_9AGAR|nr:hypothetical protein GGX14DRAFT_556903 [Mycena pura]
MRDVTLHLCTVHDAQRRRPATPRAAALHRPRSADTLHRRPATHAPPLWAIVLHRRAEPPLPCDAPRRCRPALPRAFRRPAPPAHAPMRVCGLKFVARCRHRHDHHGRRLAPLLPGDAPCCRYRCSGRHGGWRQRRVGSG